MRFILLFSLLFIASLSFGQDYMTKKNAPGKAMKAYKKINNLYHNRDYDKALKECSKALKSYPKFVTIHKLHIKLYQDLDDKAGLVKAYEGLIAAAPDYSPAAYYSLGMIKNKMGKTEEAIPHLQKYLTFPNRKETYRKKAELVIKNGDFVLKAKANPVPFDPKRMGSNINTPYYKEYLPSLTADGTTMVYTVKERGQEDFYVSQKIGGFWQKGTSMGAPINTRENEGAQSISADGKLLVFTACNRRGDFGSCDLYYSTLKRGKWTKPKNIGEPINSKAWESQPALSPNGQSLYFSSSRAGGKGKADLYVSHRQPNGKWGEPINLGDKINTPEDEQTPFIHADGQTMYFTSKGHPGMGGHDIYYVRKMKNGEWGTPTNLGYPINTTSNEGSLIVSLDGVTAYYASDQHNPLKDIDLFEFELYEKARPTPATYVKAKVRDAKTKQPLKANVDFLDIKNNQSFLKSMTDAEGEFLVCLPQGNDYALNVNKEKYLFHSENFALGEANSIKEPFILEIFLQPIPEAATAPAPPKPVKPSSTPAPPPPKSKPIVLKNVFFETGSAALKPESRTELNRLKQLLTENLGMRIQINGHTDNVGSDASNQTLSDNRAKAVMDYLIQNGIASGRLRSQGFGETQPIDSNETEIGRRNNRRTEFVVF